MAGAGRADGALAGAAALRACVWPTPRALTVPWPCHRAQGLRLAGAALAEGVLARTDAVGARLAALAVVAVGFPFSRAAAVGAALAEVAAVGIALTEAAAADVLSGVAAFAAGLGPAAVPASGGGSNSRACANNQSRRAATFGKLA